MQERTVWQQDITLNSNTLVDGNNELLINSLKTELTYLATKRIELSDTELERGRGVTIIGDASVPYQVLKQIMAACADSDYRNISLAVKKIAKSTQEGV